MLSISTKGSFRRPVIVVGPIALKFACNEAGRVCNRYEANLYRRTTPARRAMLCPVLWVSPGGLVLIMRSSVPLAEIMSLEDYLFAAEEWDVNGPREDGCPFETKSLRLGLVPGTPCSAGLFDAGLGEPLTIAAMFIVAVVPCLVVKVRSLEVLQMRADLTGWSTCTSL